MALFPFPPQVFSYPMDPINLGMLQTLVLLANITISCLQIVAAVGLSYYYLLLVASTAKSHMVEPDNQPNKSFAIAIPAHNEEAVLAKTVQTLKNQRYTSHLFDIYVIADHCDDNTAEIARRSGAICYERSEEPRGRKAYALQWLLERILAGEKNYDALVIFDADSQVDSNFLQAMNHTLDRDHLVLQGKHVIANPQGGSFRGLAAVDMRLNNLLRNQAKQNLGLSCRLMGDAMCFATDVIRQHGWLAESLTEDREYALYLLTQGIQIGYVSDAVSFGQAAPGWREASSQRLRWYGGVFHIQKKFAFRLFKLGIQKSNWAALDQAVELLLPSFSVLALLSLCVAMIQWVWPSLRPLFLPQVSTGMALAWVIFPFLGLWLDKAPVAAFQSLLYSPIYLIWRLWLGFRARILRGRVQWVRTRRHEEATLQIPEA